MKQFNPFPDVHNRYGAPWGRRSHGCGRLLGLPLYRFRARRQGGGEGYDKGGAYWGTPSNVWGVWAWVDDEVCWTYVRARDRIEAINKVREGEE